MHSHDFTAMYLNEWCPEPEPTIGIHERIAHELAEEISKTIPCYVEGPPTPEEGWANVHIQGLGNDSLTISVWSDKFVLAKFNNALRTRKAWKDKAYEGCGRRFEKLMCEPGSVEWIIRHALREILVDGSCLYNCFDRDTKIRKLYEHTKYEPATMFLGRPYYLI